jgi:hypothetical protein
MAEDIITRILLTGAEQVRKLLSDIGDAGNKAFTGVGDAATKASSNLDKVGGSILRASVSFQTVQTPIGQLGTSFTGLVGSVGEFASAFGKASLVIAGIGAVSATTVGGLFALTKSASDTVQELVHAAEAAGTTANAFAGLGFAAQQSGADISSLSRGLSVISDAEGNAIDALNKGLTSTTQIANNVVFGFEKVQQASGKIVGGFSGIQVSTEDLNRTIAQTPAAINPSQAAIEKLGIKLTDAAGHAKDGEKVYLEIADKIAAIQNPADRAAAAIEIFGRRLGPGLVGNLSKGSAGIKAMQADFAALGGTFSDTELKLGTGFSDAISRLDTAVSGLKDHFALAFSPTFTAIINGMADSIAKATPFVKAMGEAMSDQLGVALKVVGGIINSTIIPVFKVLASAAQSLVDAFNKVFGTNLQLEQIAAFVALLTGLAIAIGAVVLVVGGIASVFGIFASVFTTGIAVVTSFVGVITSLVGVFAEVGTAIAGAALLFDPITLIFIAIGAAVGVLIAVLANLDWAGFAAGASDAWNAVLQFASDTIKNIEGAFQTFINDLSAGWATISSTAQTLWDNVTAIFNAGIATIEGAWSTVQSSAESAWSNIVSTVTGALASITSAIQGVINFMHSLEQAAKDALSAILAAISAQSSSGSGAAGGGRVWGPGTSTSDSVPKMLSVGEWVIRAAAVKKYGNNLFAALNSMALPADALRRLLTGMAGGGLVDMFSGLTPSSPRFAMAEGGAVTPEDVVRIDLSILGEQFRGLTAPRVVAEKLVRFALTEQAKSGGRKPGWYLE